MLEILSLLNSLSPLGLAALLALVLYNMSSARKEVTSLRDNHLHEVTDAMVVITAAIQRMEVSLARIETLVIRLNGETSRK